jgi:hypothetical protein
VKILSILTNTIMNNFSSNAPAQDPHPGIALGNIFEAESLLRNIDPRNLVAPLRKAQAAISHAPAMLEKSAPDLRTAVDLQEQWEGWMLQRELLRNDIQRGKECLQEVRRELSTLRTQLGCWPAYERICGYNPLSELLQSIRAKECIEQFLPEWIESREQQLAALNLQMKPCAQQNGLEHLI